MSALGPRFFSVGLLWVDQADWLPHLGAPKQSLLHWHTGERKLQGRLFAELLRRQRTGPINR